MNQAACLFRLVAMRCRAGGTLLQSMAWAVGLLWRNHRASQMPAPVTSQQVRGPGGVRAPGGTRRHQPRRKPRHHSQSVRRGLGMISDLTGPWLRTESANEGSGLESRAPIMLPFQLVQPAKRIDHVNIQISFPDFQGAKHKPTTLDSSSPESNVQKRGFEAALDSATELQGLMFLATTSASNPCRKNT
jgi:hypothetical protein